MTHHFCTYFDRHYLTRGLALYDSLREHARDFRLWVLCMDEPCRERLRELSLPGIEPVPLAELEQADPALRAARETRSRIEYYFTCTPCLPRFLMVREGLERVTYLDADLYFFSDPEPIFQELGTRSVMAIEHRFPDRLAHLEQYGRFNVGCLSFRNDAEGRECLEWWRERCLEWCFDRLEGRRFADQKYLDSWPARFPSFCSLRHAGAGLAPWNVARHDLRWDGRQVRVDGVPLLFFHFQGFKQVGIRTYETGLASFGVRMEPLLKRRIYGPYLEALLRRARGEAGGTAQADSIRHPASAAPAARRLRTHAGNLLRALRRSAAAARGVLSGERLLELRGRVV